jgi:L-alanine-DL-glutamate epimerase-like enolase superfamily enzyme
LETPFAAEDLALCARLTKVASIPLAAGEHSSTRREFLDLMDRGGVRVVQPYVRGCGGLSEVRKIAELASQRGATICPGNWATLIHGMATVHFAATLPGRTVIEWPPTEIYWSPLRPAIQELGSPIKDGRISRPTALGIGIDLPDDLVAHFRVG